MKQVQLGQPAGLERLRLAAADPRRPGPGEVLVRVVAASLNFHDLSVVTGRIPTVDGRVPLSDAAGEVVEVGGAHRDSDLSAFVPGDRVMSVFFPRWSDGRVSRDVTLGVPGDDSDGFASEYVTVPACALTRQPVGLTDEESATLPCAALTAWKALMVDGPLLPGETVVVQGTGGVSVFALQLAKAAGAVVIATSSSDEKLERMRLLGADHLINYRQQPQWARSVVDFTGGLGADHVIEVGGAATLGQSLRACRVGGHVAMIGVLTGHEGSVPTALLMAKNIRLQGVTVGSRRHQMDMSRAIESCSFRPVIDARFPLEELANAFRHQEAGRHFGKIVVNVSSNRSVSER